MFDGVVVSIINDFLGNSVIVEHAFPDRGYRQGFHDLRSHKSSQGSSYRQGAQTGGYHGNVSRSGPVRVEPDAPFAYILWVGIQTHFI